MLRRCQAGPRVRRAMSHTLSAMMLACPAATIRTRHSSVAILNFAIASCTSLYSFARLSAACFASATSIAAFSTVISASSRSASITAWKSKERHCLRHGKQRKHKAKAASYRRIRRLHGLHLRRIHRFPVFALLVYRRHELLGVQPELHPHSQLAPEPNSDWQRADRGLHLLVPEQPHL